MNTYYIFYINKSYNRVWNFGCDLHAVLSHYFCMSNTIKAFNRVVEKYEILFAKL